MYSTVALYGCLIVVNRSQQQGQPNLVVSWAWGIETSLGCHSIAANQSVRDKSQ